MVDIDLKQVEAERRRIAESFLVEEGKRPRPSARGIHHVALLSSDVEQTVRFYQGVLEFPLIEIFENRDYQGSNHFFFNLGHGNTLAFFDFPVSISAPTPRSWAACTMSPSRSSRNGGSSCGPNSIMRESTMPSTVRCRCTSGIRTVPGSS